MRNYKISESHSKEWLKVEITDEYGCETTVYEKNILDASKFIVKWWSGAKKRKEERESLSRAIQNCIELDKKGGLHFTDSRGNHRDGLD
jgi:hypothetical protein